MQTNQAPAQPCLPACLQVLLLFNLDVLNGLANGTRGVVEEFVPFREYLRQVSLLLMSPADLCGWSHTYRYRGYIEHEILCPRPS